MSDEHPKHAPASAIRGAIAELRTVAGDVGRARAALLSAMIDAEESAGTIIRLSRTLARVGAWLEEEANRGAPGVSDDLIRAAFASVEAGHAAIASKPTDEIVEGASAILAAVAALKDRL